MSDPTPTKRQRCTFWNGVAVAHHTTSCRLASPQPLRPDSLLAASKQRNAVSAQWRSPSSVWTHASVYFSSCTPSLKANYIYTVHRSPPPIPPSSSTTSPPIVALRDVSTTLPQRREIRRGLMMKPLIASLLVTATSTRTSSKKV